MTDQFDADTPEVQVKALQVAYYQALELAQFRGGFLARAAHELRSPLNKAISLQQMILEGLCDDPAEEREFITEAQAASLKLLEYLDFLIHLSKIESSRLMPEMQGVTLATVFERVKDLTYLQAAHQNLRLVVEVPSEAVQVWADPVWLRNALTTLVEVMVDSCDRGTLRLWVAPESSEGVWHLWLESDRAPQLWQAAVELPSPTTFDLERPLAADLRLDMVKTMLVAMGGKLEKLTAHRSESTLCLQCTLREGSK